MKTTRRNFIAGISGIGVGAAPATVAISWTVAETQEERCIRLSKELLDEFSKLPSQGASEVGPFATVHAAGVDCLRYVRGDDGLDTLIAMIWRDGEGPVDKSNNGEKSP